MKNIKKNNAGSTFIIVLIVMALFIMLVSIFSMQINNQIKNSSKHYENQEQKYLAESGLEKTIGDISNKIELVLNNDNASGMSVKNNSTELKINSMNTKEVSSIYFQGQNHEGHLPINLNYNEIIKLNNSIASSNTYNVNSILAEVYNELVTLSQPKKNKKELKLNNNVLESILNLKEDTRINFGTGNESLILKLSNIVKNNNIDNINNKIYKDEVYVIGTYIDKKIEETLDIELKLDEVANDNSENYKNNIRKLKEKLKDVKYNLTEFECKLGIYTFGESDDNNEEIEREIILNIPQYKYPDQIEYKVNGYERQNISIPIKVNYKNGKIVKINPNKVKFQGIESIGYKEYKEYKIEADITFNIGKSNGKYKVISYDIDKWQRYD